MEWLTAILAFATTMLIFSMITSTLVETFHRLAGSRSFGLIKMLEHMYNDVIRAYVDDGQNAPEDDEKRKAQREAFVERMILVRAPARPVVETADASKQVDPWLAPDNPLRKLLRYLRGLWFRRNGASRLARDLGVGQRRLLSHLPVVTFMERLGSSEFSRIWSEKYAKKPELGERVLQDIGQKFELYGQEASIFFERKARTIAALMAMIVAWTFYVHPYDLIQTYLQRPEVAAKVADLSEDLLKDGEQSEIEELVNELQAVEAPVGWSTDKGSCKPAAEGAFCWFYWPGNPTDVVWLLIGGLLVGLGAPFWAKAVRQITEVRDAPKNVAEILKTEPQTQTVKGQQTVTTAAGRSEAIEAFYVASAGEHVVATANDQ